MTTTMTSRQFNQDLSTAKRAASKEPVIITDRGKPAHVLLSFEEYRDLTEGHSSIIDQIAMIDGGEVDFTAPRANDKPREANLS